MKVIRHMKSQRSLLLLIIWLLTEALGYDPVWGQKPASEARLPKQVIVQAQDMKLVLELTQRGIKAQSLVDERTNQQLLISDSLPLFSLAVQNPQTKQKGSLHADVGWRKVDVKRTKGTKGYLLKFRQPIDEQLKGIEVNVTLSAHQTEPAFEWDIQINNNTTWSLMRVKFPQLSILRPGNEAKVFIPFAAGVETTEPWNKKMRQGGTYPSCRICMQYLAAYNADQRTGLYVAMHDPFGSTKDIFIQSNPEEKRLDFIFYNPVPDMGKGGNDFDLPGKAVWQLLRGDWYDAAMIYRRWVSKEAKWWPQLGPDGRSDTPLWFRESLAWTRIRGSAAECVNQVLTMAKQLQLPTGFHWYNWHKIPYDNDYPHYLPPKEDFSQGVAQLQKAGVRVMPYINGRLWDIRDKGLEDWQFTSIALPWATKKEDGQPYTEAYIGKESDGSRATLAAMCPATSFWQKKVREIVLEIFEKYGVNGVYIDQVAAAKPLLCFDESHGHPLGGGHWWVQGYWEMLESIRVAKPADCILTTECNGEPYLKWFDGFLTWHWQDQDMVPAFSAVYGGTIQMFGRAYRGGPTQDLANRMKAGQQLVFGEQIGWWKPEVLKREESGPFLQDCVRIRWLLRRYFYAGLMSRPPLLLDEIPTVTADWQWFNREWPITTKAVMTGAWRLPQEKKLVLIFANVSDQTLNTRVKCFGNEYDLTKDSHTVTTITADGFGDKFIFSASEQPVIILTPCSIIVWEIIEN